MKNTKFKPIFLLALLFPLIGAGLGHLLSGMGTQPATQTVSSISDAKPGETVTILSPDDPLPSRETRTPGSLELNVYLALICGFVALLYQYLKSPLAWSAVILLALGFALIYHNQIGFPLTQFFLINLGLGALLTLLIKFLFFHKALLRFRMIVTSLVGAGLIALYYRGLFWLTNSTFEPGYWSGFFVNGLLLFVFIAFGLSLADMIIQRADLQNLRLERSLDDEDEDA